MPWNPKSDTAPSLPASWNKYRPNEVLKIGKEDKTGSSGFLKGLMKRKDSGGTSQGKTEVRVTVSRWCPCAVTQSNLYSLPSLVCPRGRGIGPSRSTSHWLPPQHLRRTWICANSPSISSYFNGYGLLRTVSSRIATPFGIRPRTRESPKALTGNISRTILR